jgi:hypothetical protein
MHCLRRANRRSLSSAARRLTVAGVTFSLSIAGLFGLGVASANAGQTWDATVAEWNALPGGWHAEYREGKRRTVVDTLPDVGQRVQEYAYGGVTATRYRLWADGTQQSWVKYAGLDACYQTQSGPARWRLDREGLALSLSRAELLAGTPPVLPWNWRATSAGWELRADRVDARFTTSVVAAGKGGYAKQLRVKVKSGSRVVRSSSVRISAGARAAIKAPGTICARGW